MRQGMNQSNSRTPLANLRHSGESRVGAENPQNHRSSLFHTPSKKSKSFPVPPAPALFYSRFATAVTQYPQGVKIPYDPAEMKDSEQVYLPVLMR
jgi:hypothetical protein